MKQVASSQLLESILNGPSPYIKRGYLQFHRITVQIVDLRTRVTFTHKDGTALVYLEGPNTEFDQGRMLDIAIHEGNMKVKFLQ